MQSIKNKVLEAIKNLSEDADYEEIMETIYVQQKIHRGFAQIERGEYFTHEQMRDRLKRWLE